MYAPLARSSLARVGSTRDTQLVTRFTLSLGVSIPQFAHWTSSLRPFPPLLRPRDLLFFGISSIPGHNRWTSCINYWLLEPLCGQFPAMTRISVCVAESAHVSARGRCDGRFPRIQDKYCPDKVWQESTTSWKDTFAFLAKLGLDDT